MSSILQWTLETVELCEKRIYSLQSVTFPFSLSLFSICTVCIDYNWDCELLSFALVASFYSTITQLRSTAIVAIYFVVNNAKMLNWLQCRCSTILFSECACVCVRAGESTLRSTFIALYFSKQWMSFNFVTFNSILYFSYFTCWLLPALSSFVQSLYRSEQQ